MRRIYFRCPETGKEASFTSEIAEERIRGALFREVLCRHCGLLHCIAGKDAVRSRAVPKRKAVMRLR